MNYIDLLAEDLRLFRRMKDLAARQNALLSEDNMDMFLNLANERAGIQREIAANQKRQNAPYDTSLKEAAGENTNALRAKMAEEIQSIEKLDGKAQEVLQQKRDALLSEIKNLRKGQRAMKGYGAKSARDPKFIDSQG